MAAPLECLISNYAGNSALAHLLSSVGGWLGIHLTSPTALGLYATELAGGEYARQRIVFSPPSGKVQVSRSVQSFHGLPAHRAAWLAVWYDAGAGDMIFAVRLAVPITVREGGPLVVAKGDIALSL
jgi:hypothetical protein